MLAVDAAHQLQDLGLDGHVERRGRLVGQQQLRLARQRDRNQRPLLHAAAELVGICAVAIGGRRDADLFHHLDHALPFPLRAPPVKGPASVLDHAVQPQRLADLLAHRKGGVQRAERVLEDHRNLLAAHGPHCLRRQLEQVAIFVEDAPAIDPAGAGYQPQDGEQRGALPAPRLADDPKNFAAAHG